MLFELDFISLIGIVIFLAIGSLLMFFWQKSRPKPKEITSQELMQLICDIQASTAEKLIRAGFGNLYHIIAISPIQFAQKVQNYEIELETAERIYKNSLSYIKRSKIIWIKKYQFIIALFVIIATISAPISFMNFRNIINQKVITPEMVIPKTGSNWDEIKMIQINFDNFIKQTQIEIQVFQESSTKNPDIKGSIKWWTEQAIRWEPQNPIIEPGEYLVKVQGKRINTTIFYFGINIHEPGEKHALNN